MSESTCSAFGFVEFLHLNPFGLLVTGNHHLANALAVFDSEIFVRQVDKYDAYFSAIVGIDGAGSVENCDSVLQCKTTTWTNLCFVTFWKFNEKSSRYEFALHWLQCYCFA